MKTKIIVTLGILLIFTNGFSAYRLLDMGVTLTYANIDRDDAFESLTAYKAICSELTKGLSKANLVKLLNKTLPESEFFEKEGAINNRSVSIKLDKNKNVALSKACE